MKRKLILALGGVFGLLVFTEPARAADPAVWKQEVSAGYSQKTGNTQNSQMNAAYQGIRTTPGSELTAKASTLYSSQKNKMDGQKHTGSLRYAPKLDDTDWFGFGMFAAEHDRFAGVDYRLVPSIGTGYWFSNTETWKVSAELGLGYEYNNYSNGTDEENTLLIPRAYAEKTVFDKACLSEELIMYSSLEDAAEYRLRSETKFTNPLSDTLSLRVSFIDEFNTGPIGDAKKNDTQFMVSLVYAF